MEDGGYFKQLYLSYAATLLYKTEFPVSEEEFSPPYLGYSLGKASRRVVRSSMLSQGDMKEVRLHGHVFYIGFNIENLRQLSLYGLSAQDTASWLEKNGLTIQPMTRSIATQRSNERHAKLNVAFGALDLLARKSTPFTTSALFQVLHDDKIQKKFEQRVVWYTAWQTPFLQRVAKTGAIRMNSGNPSTFEVSDLKMLESIMEAKTVGDACLSTLLWPDNPCDVDHTVDKNQVHFDHSIYKENPRPELPSAVLNSTEEESKSGDEDAKPETAKPEAASNDEFIKPSFVKQQLEFNHMVLDALKTMNGLMKSLGGEVLDVNRSVIDMVKGMNARMDSQETSLKNGLSSTSNGLKEVSVALAKVPSQIDLPRVINLIEKLRLDVRQRSDREKIVSFIHALDSRIGDLDAVRDLVLDSIMKSTS